MKLTQFIIKVVERCNLNCSYCYMYNQADKTYLKKPARMSMSVFRATLSRINALIAADPSLMVSLIFHGGEPMLLPPEWCRALIQEATEVLGSSLSSISMQSNGTLVTDEWISLLQTFSVKVGCSIDGPRYIHDLFRIDHNNNGVTTGL